jgi:hypothetical protein
MVKEFLMNNGYDHCRKLAASIQNIFAAGFQADVATVHFINSTFDYPDYRKLQRLLNDADNCDRDGLIDLIVSPDATVCREMEALLSRVSFTDRDIQAVFSMLPEEMQTSVRVAGLTPAVPFSVPPACRRRFLSQLQLTRQTDPDIRDALETRLPGNADRMAALSKIRHSRPALTGSRKTVLLQFIRLSGRVNKEQWFLYLDVILALLGRQKAGEDLLTVLGAERENCLKQVENSRRLTEQLNRSNMETVLLQGGRIGLSADIPKLSQHIKTIDEISLLLWGRRPLAGAADLRDPDTVSILFEKEFPR